MRNNKKAHILFIKIFIFFLPVIISGCKTDSQLEREKESDIIEKQIVRVPIFNEDSAYYFIERQVEFGPRIPNTPPHFQTADYLIARLEGYSAEVIVQEFQETAYDGSILNLKNIIASFYPDLTRRILLAAHWDTRPFADKDELNPRKTFDGANDGGSGVGVLLEIARVLSTVRPYNAGVDIILFDGEDYGEPEFYEGNNTNTDRIHWCLGSQYWSKNKHKKNYIAYYGILLDMVGAKGATFYKEGGSMQYAKKIVEKVWEAGHISGYNKYFINHTSPGITDDHVFVNVDGKIPMINIVEYNPNSKDSYFGPYHHTQEDNMELIDKTTLKAVGQTLIYMIFNE
jgi:hypothetical protein